MKPILLFVCLCISSLAFAAPKTQVGTVLSPPRPIVPFELTDNKNQPFTNQQFQNKWSLIFFGFTRCTMICPTTMQMLSQLYQRLESDKTNPMPQIILVSVDPERDTPADMNKYVTSFNPTFMGLTGNPTEIQKLARQMSILYMKVTQQGEETIDHSGAILLINPKGELYAVFSTPHDPKIIAKDYQSIIKNYTPLLADTASKRIPQFENNKAKVWNTIIYPGKQQTLTMHRHEHDRVLVALTNGTIKIVSNKRETHYLKLEKDKAYYLAKDIPGELHTDENEGKEPISVMLIELKG